MQSLICLLSRVRLFLSFFFFFFVTGYWS
jgi:hypothetical protein